MPGAPTIVTSWGERSLPGLCERGAEQLDLRLPSHERRPASFPRIGADPGARPDRLPGEHRLRLAPGPYRLECLVLDRARGLEVRRLADEYAVHRRGCLQAGGNVDEVRDDPLAPVHRHVGLDERLARVDADADAELAQAVLLAALQHGIPDRERGAHGSLGVVLVRHRDAPDRHDAVADVLLDRAADPLDLAVQEGVVGVEQPSHVLGIAAVDTAREAHEVGEEDRDVLSFLREHRQRLDQGHPAPAAEAEAVRILLAAARADWHVLSVAARQANGAGYRLAAVTLARVPENELHYRFAWSLKSTPEELWPLVADTNRFNLETGTPEIETSGGPAPPGYKSLELRVAGRSIPYREAPFEWVRPRRFGVERRYGRGPFRVLRVLVELDACRRRRHGAQLPGLGHAARPGRPAAGAGRHRPGRAAGASRRPSAATTPWRWPSVVRLPQRSSNLPAARLPGSHRAGASDSRGSRPSLQARGSTAASSIGWRRRSRPPTTSTRGACDRTPSPTRGKRTVAERSSSFSTPPEPGSRNRAGSCCARSVEERLHRATPSPAFAATCTAARAGSISPRASSNPSSSCSARARRSARWSRPTTASAARS